MLRLAEGAVATMEARGAIQIRGPDDVSVLGDALRWAAILPEEIRVRGERQGAQAFQGEDLIEAPLLRVLREQKIVVGEEGAITEIRSVAGGRGSLFEGSDPLRVRSRRVLAPLDADGETVFEGPVKAWQFDTTLDASKMRFRRLEERLIAESSEGRPVRGRFVLGEEGRAPRTVLMTTELLDYLAGERRAKLVGGASFKDGPLFVTSERMDVTLGEEGGIERLEATGLVKLEHRDDEAQCERLVWTGGDAGVIELYGASPLALLYASEQNQTVRSARIRYYPETKTFETEGEGGRTVIGAPQPETEKPETQKPEREKPKDESDGER
jgi:lipopolysaccharide export system protein LptA